MSKETEDYYIPPSSLHPPKTLLEIRVEKLEATVKLNTETIQQLLDILTKSIK